MNVPSEDATETTREHPGGAPVLLSRLGRYVQLEALGSGGMGHVVRAYDPRLRREVAVKRLRPELGCEDEVARMIREARAMAKLNHLNVVRVFDVEMVGGIVLIAMELVMGASLDQWARVRERSWRQVVELYLQAGEGLLAAHRAEILHRDFKPANVLVREDDVAKVTDFGLARSMLAADTPSSSTMASWSGTDLEHVTQSGMVMGTPAFMPPEQHLGGEVDERADQYAFCASAWASLAGSLAFSSTPGRGSLYRQKLRGPPSWRSPKKVPKRLVRVLQRGLQPNPDDRWRTMDELLAALRSTLSLRRRPIAITVAVGALVSAAASGGVATAADDCSTADDRMDELWSTQRQTALRERLLRSRAPYLAASWKQIAAEVDLFVERWREVATRSCQARRRSETPAPERLDLQRICLERAASVLRARLEAIEFVEESALVKIHGLADGLPDVRSCAQAQSLVDTMELPPTDPRAQRHLQELEDRLDDARAANVVGSYERAFELGQRVRSEAERIGRPALALAAELVRASALDHLGRYDEAKSAFEQVVQGSLAHRRWRLAFEASSNLVYMNSERQAHFSAGRIHCEQAKALAGRPGLDEESKARAFSECGVLYDRAGRYVEAEHAFETALSLHPREDLFTATVRNNLGMLLADHGRLEEASVLLGSAVEIRERALGSSHPELAMIRANQGNLELERGNYAEAEARYRDALEGLTRSLGPASPVVGHLHQNLSMALEAQDELDDAEVHARAAVRLFEQALGERDHQVALAHEALGNVLVKA